MDASADLIGELDLALAALRRVIVRAMDVRGGDRVQSKVQPKPQLKVEIAPVRPLESAHGITVCFDPPAIEYSGRKVNLRNRRQADLLAVLVKAMPDTWLPRKALGKQAFPDLTDLSAYSYLSEALTSLSAPLATIDLRIRADRGYGVILCVAEGIPS